MARGPGFADSIALTVSAVLGFEAAWPWVPSFPQRQDWVSLLKGNPCHFPECKCLSKAQLDLALYDYPQTGRRLLHTCPVPSSVLEHRMRELDTYVLTEQKNA